MIGVLKKSRRPTVQLTSLLDLLFIMIFLSLLQTKEMIPTAEQQAPSQEIEATPKQEKIPSQKESVISITAIFHFYATQANPNVPTGTYSMQGTFNHDDGELSLGGISWINRPPGYDMIPLSGRINPHANQFEGRVEFPGCQTFTLQRTTQIMNSPISGQWDGIYVCSQGETGLTLTIQ